MVNPKPDFFGGNKQMKKPITVPYFHCLSANDKQILDFIKWEAFMDYIKFLGRGLIADELGQAGQTI